MKAHLRKTEIMIAYVLRYGVILSALVIGFGFLKTWFFFSSQSQNLSELLSGQVVVALDPPLELSGLWSHFLNGDPVAIMAFGLMLLILLPVSRVALTVILFLLDKDYVYFLITSFVLAVLLSGLLFGKTL